MLALVFAGCSSPSGIQGRVGSLEYLNSNLNECLVLIRNNQFDKARSIYESLLTHYGSNPKYRHSLYATEQALNIGEANYWANKEKWQKAIPLTRRYVSLIEPQNYEQLASGQSILAKFLYKSGRKKEALEVAKTAIKTNPDCVNYYILVHDICLDLAAKDSEDLTYVEEAFQHLTRAQKIDPANPLVQKILKMWETTQKEEVENITSTNEVE